MTDSIIATAPEWSSKYAARAANMKNSAIRDLFKYLGMPGIISFAGGLPAPETFPVELIKQTFTNVLSDAERTTTALQYGPTEGYLPLRKHLADKVNKYGVPAGPSNILLTCGSQQALDLIGKIFVDENTTILTERPTYLGALQAWDSYGAKYITVGMDKDGMLVDEIPALIEKHHPKFIYTVSTFHNPGGVCLSLERREKLAKIAEKYDLFIVEDDPYGELRFEGEHITPIVSLIKERTLYLCTFSKTLAPSLRVGYVIAPEEVILKLVQAKQGADLFSSMILQMVVSDICASGILPDHVKKTRALYKIRRDAMVSSMEQYFPDGVTWSHPTGGLFLWVTVPDKIIVPEFFKIAIEEKVAFVPGRAFYPYETPTSLRTMRLNFSFSNPETIEEGIKRLGNALKKELVK